MGLFSFVGDTLGLGGGQEEAQLSFEELKRMYGDIELPDYDRMAQDIEARIRSGQITPEQGQTFLQEASGLSSYSADPRLKGAQLAALGELESIGKAGGLRMSDKAMLEDIAREEDVQDRGAREAIEQNAKMRGVGGSGLELASKLISQQEGAGRRAKRGFDVGKLAEERALQAIMGAGQMGGQMRGQDFAEAESKARAQDAINAFNARMRADQQESNLGRKERAAFGNRDWTTNRWDKADEMRRQRFQDEMQRTTGQAGAIQGVAGMQADRGRSRDEFMGNVIGTGALMYAMSDVNAKENIESAEPDLEEFLSKLTMNEYDYKEPEKYGRGKHFGPMAQDLEKSKIGRTMVEETPDGKMINYGKGQGVMLGILANLAERLEEVERAQR